MASIPEFHDNNHGLVGMSVGYAVAVVVCLDTVLVSLHHNTSRNKIIRFASISVNCKNNYFIPKYFD